MHLCLCSARALSRIHLFRDCSRWLLPVSLSLGIGAALVRDLFGYWVHRLQHSSRWLWAQHEFHHSEEHMNVTTTWRHHWLEIPIQMLFVTAPLQLLFGLRPMTLAMAILIFQVPSYFIHLNSRIRFGALGMVFACPQTHRIHHSVEARHIDKNFAGFFTFWDVIFGTYYHRRKMSGRRRDWLPGRRFARCLMRWSCRLSPGP